MPNGGLPHANTVVVAPTPEPRSPTRRIVNRRQGYENASPLTRLQYLIRQLPSLRHDVLGPQTACGVMPLVHKPLEQLFAEKTAIVRVSRPREAGAMLIEAPTFCQGAPPPAGARRVYLRKTTRPVVCRQCPLQRLPVGVELLGSGVVAQWS